MKDVRDDPYVSCRRGGGRHNFEEIRVLRKTNGGIPVDFRCTDCGTVRHDIMNYLYEVISRYYEYPKDWRDFGPYTTQELRRESIRRATGKVFRP